MAKRSKRSLAALKGWRTRRHNLRSEAAKKGWRTRRRNAKKKKREITPPPPPPIEIERRVYKKKGKETPIEIHRRGEKIIEIHIRNRSYTRPEDLDSLRSVIEASEPVA